jgi:hypothetical protein
VTQVGKTIRTGKETKVKKQTGGFDPRRHRTEYKWDTINSEETASKQSTSEEETGARVWRKTPARDAKAAVVAEVGTQVEAQNLPTSRR